MRISVFVTTLLAAALLSCASLSAQESAGGRPFYFDYGFGLGAQTYRITGDATTVTTLSNGDVSSFSRLSYFFDDHWGTFFQVGSITTTLENNNFLSTVNQADGERFLYRPTSDYSWNTSNFYVGASYRWTKGKIEYIQRAGIGYTSILVNDMSYMRVSRDGSTGPEYFTYSAVRVPASTDYLLDNDYEYELQPRLSSMVSLQIIRRFRKFFYVFMEPMVNYTFQNGHCEKSYYGSKPAYEITNWAESMYYGDTTGQWVVDSASQSSTIVPWGSRLSFRLNFGLGINFNVNRKHRHE